MIHRGPSRLMTNAIPPEETHKTAQVPDADIAKETCFVVKAQPPSCTDVYQYVV